MAGWRSRREKLIAWAESLGLDVAPGITDDELYERINSRPATKEQLRILAEIIGRLGRTLPPGLTYGQAREYIGLVQEDANKFAIASMGLREPDTSKEMDDTY